MLQMRATMKRQPDPDHELACPVLLIERHPRLLAAIEDHSDYLRGVLPRPGGLAAQEAHWLDLQRLMESEAALVRREEQEAREKKNGKGRR